MHTNTNTHTLVVFGSGFPREYRSESLLDDFLDHPWAIFRVRAWRRATFTEFLAGIFGFSPRRDSARIALHLRLPAAAILSI